MMWGGYTWGWPGFVLAAIFMVACVALMGRMMGHGRMSNRMNHVHGSAQQSPAPYGTEVPDQILERRLVSGEIDIDEYNRLRDVLADIGSPASGDEGKRDQH
jgi:uncharacterized membrane protein